MEFTKEVKEKNITLSVTVKCEEDLTENKKREILTSIADTSHQLYLEVADELNSEEVTQCRQRAHTICC